MFAKKFFYGVLALVLVVPGLGLLAVPANAATDPISVVRAYLDAYNAGDIDGAMGYVADNAIFLNPTGAYLGKARVRENLEAIKKDGFAFEYSNLVNVQGRVVYSYKVIIGGVSVETGDGGLTIVRGDKIVFDGTTDTEKDWAPAVVKAYYDAYNAGDLDLAASYLADDVIFINPTGTHQGKDAARTNLEAIKKDGLRFDIFDLKNTNGRVQYSYKVNIAGETVETGTGGLTTVKNGLIVFDGTTETEAQLPTTGAESLMNALWLAAVIGAMLIALGAFLLKLRIA